MAILINNAIKSVKNEIKVYNSSDLRLVSNVLSSPAIIHAGKQDEGCKWPLLPIATGLKS